MLEAFKNDHQALIEMIVSPDTDGLTYIIHYAHRLRVIRGVEFERGYLLRPSEEWKTEHAGDAKRLLNGVIVKLNEMYPIGEESKLAKLLIVTIVGAIGTLH